MAWHRTDDKLSSKSMMTKFSDAYVQHYKIWIIGVQNKIATILQPTFLTWLWLYFYSNFTEIRF